MSTIFAGSTKLLSSQRTSRFIGPFLRWVSPSISDAQIRSVQYVIRKCGHVSEYAVLSVLVWNAWRRSRPMEKKIFWACAKGAILVCALYAATDELHQSFEPSREASIVDVFIDTCGAGVGVLVIWVLGRWRGYWE